MKIYDKLVFVGTDNTALSAMAEAIMQQRFALEDILIESRGLVVLFPEPINPKAEAILASHGLTMKAHRSSQLTEDDFDERTLILTMNEEMKDKLLSDFRNALNVYTLTEYIGVEEEINDPYGKELAEYGHCYDQLAILLDQLAEQLLKEDI